MIANPSNGSRLDLTLEKPAVGGRMIARHDGKVILVSGGIPGERVRVRLERVKRDVAYGRVEDVLVADPDRRPVDGDPACGSTVFAHVSYERQLQLKREIVADAFARIGRFASPTPIAIAPSPVRGYRMRARLHVAGARVGFLREGTHQLCDAARTGQLSPAAVRLLDRMAAVLAATPTGGIREIDLVENLAGDQQALHLWLDRRHGAPERVPGLATLDGVRGISASARRDASIRVLTGTPVVIDPLAALVPSAAGPVTEGGLQRHAAAFFQGNRFLLPRLVQRVVEALPTGGVIDLYAGVGLFAIAAATSGRRPVIAVEGDRVSSRDLHANAAGFGSLVRVQQQSVERFLRRQGHALDHTVIVDPPRTGLSREVLAGLGGCGAPRLVYVSCDVATFARDLRVLLGHGYCLGRVDGFDLFPGTAHLELVAVLTR